MGFEKCKNFDSVFKELNKMIDKQPFTAFKKKSMDWDELKEKAKELGYKIEYGSVWNSRYYFRGEYITNHYITFFSSDGNFFVENEIIAYDRTPEQMYQIMEALK